MVNGNLMIRSYLFWKLSKVRYIQIGVLAATAANCSVDATDDVADELASFSFGAGASAP